MKTCNHQRTLICLQDALRASCDGEDIIHVMDDDITNVLTLLDALLLVEELCQQLHCNVDGVLATRCKEFRAAAIR